MKCWEVLNNSIFLNFIKTRKEFTGAYAAALDFPEKEITADNDGEGCSS